jgi:hypothetical protein
MAMGRRSIDRVCIAAQNVDNNGGWKSAECVVDQYSWRFWFELKQASFSLKFQSD